LTRRDSLDDGDIADNLEVHTGIVPSRMGLPGSRITSRFRCAPLLARHLQAAVGSPPRIAQ
jgi:hypothetical protein